jgi:Response regulator containing a CheY-like receiver domain and an HTH DNA-binding domain
MCNNKIRVALLDDHPLMLMGINAQLSQSSFIDVVIATSMANDFFEKLETIKIDIAVLDIIMPNISGIEVAKILKQKYPEIKILMLSSENTIYTIKELLDIEVDGFISKLSPTAELIKAIQWICLGGTYYGTDIAKIIDGIYSAKAVDDEDFTAREMEIIRLCSQGFLAKEIAWKLGISTRTVEAHKGRIFKKLGVNSTHELIFYAFKQGIIKL